MTSLHSAYTPLESLLLFQALRSEGVQAISFNRISEQLKSIPVVRNDPTYDGGRLSPDALRELYLGLLKDEVKRDLEQRSNGDTPSRKRKAASPSLPTVHEAAQHNHLIPQLVSRLYTRYRDNAVRGLRDDERKHDLITRDLADIEAGKWDERLQRPRATPARQSPKPSSTAHTQPIATQPEDTQHLSTSFAHVVPTTETNPSLPKRLPQATFDVAISHGPDQSNSLGDRRMESPGTTLPLTSNIASNSPRLGVRDQAQPPVHGQRQGSPQPAQPTVQAVPDAQVQDPSIADQRPRPPQQSAPNVPTGNVSSTHGQQSAPRTPTPTRAVLPQPPLPLPVHAPPPPTAGFDAPAQPTQQATSTGTQTTSVLPHHPPPAQNHGQASPPTIEQRHQHRNRASLQTQPGFVPSHQYQQQQSPRHPQLQTQPQVQPHTPYAEHRTSYQPPPAQASNYSSQKGHAAGQMLAPFQVVKEPAKLQHLTPRQRQPLPPGLDQRLPQHMQHLHNAPATAPRLHGQAPSPMLSSILRGLATPPRLKSRPLWKSEHRPLYVSVSAEPVRPDVEPASPTHERPRSPARSTRSTRSRDPHAAEDSLQQVPPVKARPGRRRTNARAESPHSITSSAADEPSRARTRSQSVSTAAGATAASDDHQGHATGVKAEPSTPANLMEDPDAIPAPAATPASGPRTRKRKGTLQTHGAPPSKRRLQDSPGIPENDQDLLSSPMRRGNTVVAAKNFAKMCAAVMNDINSHKHASYFATAVRDRDAPGYGEIVFQPQNLKSIRAAITAGTRAVNAAASTLDSPTGTPAASASKSFEGSSAVELERTVDLIPPKAIVNGAQLEKELMRMFANAFMFNPGEDGMALISTEIYSDVVQTLNDWRGGDEDEEGKGKRRKL